MMLLRLTLFVLLSLTTLSHAAEPIDLIHSRAELETLWRGRVQTMLDQGKLPKIDMETSIQSGQVVDYIPGVFDTMDELGVALIAADGVELPSN